MLKMNEINISIPYSLFKDLFEDYFKYNLMPTTDERADLSIENVKKYWILLNSGTRNELINDIEMWEEPKISIEDLPKPFKPKSGDKYYYINEDGISIVRCYDEDDDSDVGMAENAQCYRTREDAQKWLDFMKSMME